MAKTITAIIDDEDLMRINHNVNEVFLYKGKLYKIVRSILKNVGNTWSEYNLTLEKL